jgi:endonuclease YncB( thermonuclease family)
MKLRWLALAVALLAPALHAAGLRATVTYVNDGDTLWVRPARGGPRMELRLLGIDAPERCQAFGAEARQALRQRVLYQPVEVRLRGRDAYDRHLAHVRRGGEDIAAWMVRHGYAWSSRYKGRRGPYAKLEAQARRRHAGLWRAAQPMEPRRFRQRFGPCR